MSVKLNVRLIDDITVIDVSGRLTLGEGVDAIREEIHRLVSRGVKKIVMNLADVSYIDSSGLGELVADFTSLQNAGGSLKLMGLTKAAKEILRLTRLSSMFEVYEEEKGAVRSFA